MATTGYGDRMLLVEVTGLRQQGVIPTSHYSFKVPYQSLARTLQFIKSRGGKVVRLHPLASSLPPLEPCQASVLLVAEQTQFSPASEAVLEKRLPTKTQTSGSTQPPGISELPTLSDLLPVEPEDAWLSNLLRLIRLFLEKLTLIWQRTPFAKGS